MVVEPGPQSYPQQSVPQQPGNVNQQPGTVNKMGLPTTVPQLPAGSGTMMRQPAGGDTESMRTMPGTTTPPAPPRSTSTGTQQAEDLFPAGGTSTTTTTTEKAGSTSTTTPNAFDDMPAGRSTTPPATTTPPTTTPPGTTTSGFDDLFPPTGSTTTPPAGGTTPPTGGTTPPAGGAAPGGSTPTDTKQPSTGGLDDLFPPAGGTTPPAGAGGTPDPFKSSAILREDGGLASEQNREWVDNTGTFKTRGRLVSLLDGQVKLMKENGRTSTVPLARLSKDDLEFVNRQASAQRAVHVAEATNVEVGTPLAAN